MDKTLMNNFYWAECKAQDALTAEEQYQQLVSWAGTARCHNPNAFDAVTEWMLNDAEWTPEKLAENEQLLMQGIIARFKEQTKWLRERLLELKPSGVVNPAVFGALDRFEDELSGKAHEEALKQPVAQMFADFSVMVDKEVRKQIAGGKTGAAGTETVEFFGYLNFLKDCDASVQWALFMPDVVKKQQNGFRVESFEYKKLPAMRFIGSEEEEHEDVSNRRKLFATLDSMSEYNSEFPHDIIFIHHDGEGVDVNEGHCLWGRFMKADAPVPEGLTAYDLIPYNDRKQGVPYMSQFAYAVFAGDDEAMHGEEGFDGGAMYDITRNTMLAQGVNIPYPDKYWVAEVYLNGHEKSSNAYLFSAEV